MNQELEKVLERVKALPDDRQWELAEVLLASLDPQSPDLSLSPERIAKAERYAASHGRFATDEEVREVFARLANRDVSKMFICVERCLYDEVALEQGHPRSPQPDTHMQS